MFKSIKKVDGNKHKVTILDGSKLRVTKMGDIQLHNKIILQSVLFVPKIHFNLICVKKLCLDNNVLLTFSPYKCCFQDSSKRELSHLGKLKHGLYYTQEKNSFEDLLKAITTPKDNLLNLTISLNMIKEIKLLHLRYGHVPFHRLKIIYPYFNTSHVQDSLICTICPLARQNWMAFTHSDIKSVHVFELLHIDLWAPYKKATHIGCTMFLTRVDDFTR